MIVQAEDAGRSKPLPSDLFGSSDEEEEENVVTDQHKEDSGSRNLERAARKPLNADIFGDSSDEEDAPPKQPAVEAKKTTRLLKQRLQKDDNASDDEDIMDMEPVATAELAPENSGLDSSSRLELNSSKRSRVITDSDDEQS